jgi:hypothetical protein
VKWTWSGVLYACVGPRREEILCIGKADAATSTVRTRWNANDKGEVLPLCAPEPFTGPTAESLLSRYGTPSRIPNVRAASMRAG